MDAFYPFIHEKKNKENEPIPLYAELIPTSPEKKEDSPEDESPGMIVIELY